jgi:hypothetical protein
MWISLLVRVMESCDPEVYTLSTPLQAAALGLIDNCGYDNVVVVRHATESIVYNVTGSAGEARSKIEEHLSSISTTNLC